jgi:Protein of unknown function (DUF616)
MRDFVYTALVGKYETLNELQISRNPSTEYICFTDDKNLKSQTWKVVVLDNFMHLSPIRRSREIKMMGHRSFPSDSRILYIDNTVQLKVDGSEILNEALVETDIAFMHHYTRRTVRGEFLAVSSYQLDNQRVINEQFDYYKKNFPEVLKQKPFWGGLIARRNSKSADKFMRSWKNQYDLFTHRDQLSINVASIISGVSIGVIPGDNDDSIWHRWPIHNQRQIQMREIHHEKKFKKGRILARAVRYGPRFYM